MQVAIAIPQPIVDICIARGWNENQTKKMFLTYLGELTEHPYHQFEIDFDNWLDGDGEDYIEDILKENL